MFSLSEPVEERVEDTHTSLVYHSPAVEAANAALAKDKENTKVVDENSLARKKHKPKRNITWASAEKLVQVSYYELQPGMLTTLGCPTIRCHYVLLVVRLL